MSSYFHKWTEDSVMKFSTCVLVNNNPYILSSGNRTPGSRFYSDLSLQDSDHEGVVRIFVALSCELGGFFIYIILYCIILYYVAQ